MPNKTSDTLTNVFTLKELFVMPINAVIEANEHAAMAAVNFIRREGFEHLTEDDVFYEFGKLRMISFSYQYVGKEGRERTMTVRIPFLSMIPLPLLEVRRATFDFGLRILDQTRNRKLAGAVPASALDRQASGIQALLVSQRRDHGDNDLDSGRVANMQVRVEIERSDIPAGLLQLMNLSQEATEGLQDKSFNIVTTPSRLLFGAHALRQTLRIVIDQRSKRSITSVDDVVVSIEVISNTLPVKDLFSETIEVVKGFVVGWPTINVVKALTNDEGAVEFAFEARANETESDLNGFVKISVDRSQEMLVYFEIANSRQEQFDAP